MFSIKSNLLLKLFISVMLGVLLFVPVVSNAQYGGTTINTNVNTSNTKPLKYTSSSTSSSATVNIESGKKGDTININFTNSTNRILSIRFTLNADVNNASLVLNKLDLSQLFAGLSETPITAFSITLTNLTYEQIINFSFDFSIPNPNTTKTYKGFSSNSPWVSANLSTPTTTNSNQDLQFTASTSIAFKQFALTANSSTMSVADLSSVQTPSSNNNSELIRTGENNWDYVHTILYSSIIFGFLALLVIESNVKKEAKK